MRVIFFGTPSFAIPTLDVLLRSDEKIVAVVAQPDKRKGRSRIPLPPPIKVRALEEDLQVLQPHNIKEAAFHEQVTLLKPDIIIVVAYGKILPVSILSLPPSGCVNVHASLLPKYRGAAPIQWAIINGEHETGITTMMMNEGLDTGPFFLQKAVSITENDTAETLSRKLSEIGATLLMETVSGIKKGTIQPVPQEGIPSFAPPLKKEDGRIIWTTTAREIFNFVRGMYPWPGAYCYLHKERIKMIKVKPLNGNGLPGCTVKTARELIVGTGDGLISIIELQPEGKKPMTSEAFLSGRHIREGSFFQ